MATLEDIQKQLEGIASQAKEVQAGAISLGEEEGTTPLKTSKLYESLLGKIMGDEGMVSSEETESEKLITGAISGLEEAGVATKKGTEARYERLRTETEEAGKRTLTGALEARRGFATNTALIRQIKDQTDKKLKDLDLREVEALAAGRTDVASQIANIKLQEIRFQQESEQKVWSNALQVAGLGLQMEAQEMQQEQIGFNKATSMISLISKYDLGDKLAPEQMRDVEKSLNLKEGALKQIIPEKDETLDFYTTDSQGNVTAVYRDRKTGNITTKKFSGIGEMAAPPGEDVLSQSAINKLSIAGVPEDVAIGLQRDFNAGFSSEVIKQNAISQYGEELGIEYFDIFKENATGAQGFQAKISIE